MKENYLKLREKYNYTPQLTPTILFYFLHAFAVKFFELNSKGDIISSGDIADIALDVYDDDRGMSFFDRKKKSKRRAIYLPASGRFPLEARERQITAAITAQFRLCDILSQYDWSKSPADNIEYLNGAEKGKLYAGRKLSEKSLIELFNDVRRVLEGDGRYCTKAGLLIYDFNNYKSIDKCIIDSFINYFSFSSFFKVVKDNGIRPVRKGEKTRIVLEALKGMEITSARKMHEALKEKGIEVSTRTVAYAIQFLKCKCAKSNNQSRYNYIDDNISRSHNQIAQNCTLKPEENVLRLLTEGKTIEEISKVLNISIRTIKNYIKKAKQEGLITNMGSKKYPKWTMDIAQNCTLKPEGDDMKKENEIAQSCTLKPEGNDLKNENDVAQGDTLKPEDNVLKNENDVAQSTPLKPEGNDLKNENDVVQGDTLKPESNITQENISRVIKSLKSIDEYLYYTGEGKDKFDEWFDFSLANS